MNTQLRTFDAAALANLNRALVGFDKIFNGRLNALTSNYPPYNIVKFDDNHYCIEVAVAGFRKDDITVQIDQDRLSIRGTHQTVENTSEYLHRGLASRDFEQVFTLAEYMEVIGAEVVDGLLRVNIERVIPEALKPRRIEIQ